MAQPKKSSKKTTEERDNSGDLPQEITESYGTGVIQQPGLNEDDITTLNDSSSELGGGDGDAAAEQESATGEQSVG
ncbi:DUF6335 family protein, partial [Microcoleus sp. herbarium19]